MIKSAALIILAVSAIANCEPPIIAGYKGGEHGVAGVTTQKQPDGGPGNGGPAGYSTVALYPNPGHFSGNGRGKSVGIFENFKRGVLRGMEHGIFGRGGGRNHVVYRSPPKTIIYEIHTHAMMPPFEKNNSTEQSAGDDIDGVHSEHSAVGVSPGQVSDNGIGVSPIPIPHIDYSAVGLPPGTVGYGPGPAGVTGAYPGYSPGIWRPSPSTGKSVGIFENFKRGVLRGMESGIFGRGRVRSQSPGVYRGPPLYVIPFPYTTVNSTDEKFNANATENFNSTEQVGGHGEYSVQSDIGISPSEVGGSTPEVSPNYIDYNTVGMVPSYVAYNPVVVPSHYSGGSWRPAPVGSAGHGKGIFEDFKRGVLRGMENGIFGLGGVRNQGPYRVPLPRYNKPYSIKSIPKKINATAEQSTGDSVGGHSEYSAVAVEPNSDAENSEPNYIGYNTVGISPSYVDYSAIGAPPGHSGGFGKSIFENFKRGVLRGMQMQKEILGGLGGAKRQNAYIATGNTLPHAAVPEQFNPEFQEGSGGENGYKIVDVGVSPGYSDGVRYAGGYGKGILESLKNEWLQGMEKALLGGLRSPGNYPGPPNQRRRRRPARKLPIPSAYDDSPWIPMKSETTHEEVPSSSSQPSQEAQPQSPHN